MLFQTFADNLSCSQSFILNSTGLKTFTMVCYSINNGSVHHAGLDPIPCGSYTPAVPQYCCASGDFCLGYSICHFTHPNAHATSGYYIGSCTDESFHSPACSRQCCELSQICISREANKFAQRIMNSKIFSTTRPAVCGPAVMVQGLMIVRFPTMRLSRRLRQNNCLSLRPPLCYLTCPFLLRQSQL